MGSSSSKNSCSSHGSLEEGGSGGQLYVSLKMENFKIRGDLIPHVFGSVPIIGSWDPSRARRMERESASMWELSFVVPPNHETLHFHFLLKPKDRDGPCVVEEGVDRVLTGGNLQGDAVAAVFRPAAAEFGDDAILEYKVFVKVDIVSPFDLAASWRAYKENLRPSTVRGIPDISINSGPEGGHESGSTTSLELDLESYLVPLPTCASAAVYAANLAETPRSVGYNREFPKYDVSSVSPSSSTTKLVTANHAAPSKTADFFRGDNPEGMEARNEVAALAMDDMLSWMKEGGKVGIFDATNSSRRRRNMLMKMAEGNCKIIFLETICNDERIIERNIRLKIQQSPDYAEETDFEAGLQDFKERLANYDQVYEPVEEGSYIKMIDMVSGHGGQIQVNNISGYLPGRIVFFLVNSHLTPRPILLTRHGESQDNVRGRIGGDSVLSESGNIYSKKLANFVEKRLKPERTASIWTSTLQRTIITATPIVGFPKIQWRALDEINAGVCDGMAYEEIKRNMPEEYQSRKKDKLRYRYPRGESYLDVIQRLEPVIIELERQRAPVVVISHQAVLRALYAYFADRPLKEIPHIEVPLHTIIEIQMGVTGVQEKRYKLMD